MSMYSVQNQWGGSAAPWNPGGTWVIGNRPNQYVVAMNVTSSDGGKTLTGTMTYAGEQAIGFRGTLTSTNNYKVENQWGGSSAPWNPGGTFILGGRMDQNVVALDFTSSNGGQTLTGTMTYAGEKPIGFKSEMTHGGAYVVENQWGGNAAPWNAGGLWGLGARKGQNVVAMNVTSSDGGKTLSGTMTYDKEQPIGFRGTLSSAGTYTVENQWGGSSAPWQPGGQWLIGSRSNQNVVAVNVSSSDGGKTLSGTMTYDKEQPIGFRGTLS
ncbi:lectin OAA family protein [Myxococcus stipitatus]|uniref:lectin OAA family protein n=1 Tax=Myxococcus stipitatus TaxID=83455 RepID=UPI0030D05162